MYQRIAVALIMIGLFAGLAGCTQKVDRAAFIVAINKSLAGTHECTWPQAIKLPAEVDPAKDARVAGFDALTDAGLLIRELVVDKPMPVGSEPMKKYNLSDKGHALWTPEPNQPGYGNFCFGRFNVTAIDKTTPKDSSNPAQYTVTYSYEVEGIPAWMHTPESMRAFRKIAADTSIQSATATLVKDAGGGWEVVSPRPAH